MRQVRDAFRTVVRLIRGGPFNGGHTKPLRFDDHSYLAVGQDDLDSHEDPWWEFTPAPAPLGIPKHWGGGYFTSRKTEAAIDPPDRYDVLMSARADREAEIAYWAGQ